MSKVSDEKKVESRDSMLNQLVEEGICTQEELTIIQENFDAEYYLFVYPDIQEAEIDPLYHYLLFGRTERRNPTSWFNAEYYLQKYQDIADSGADPFIHYLIAGKLEGRLSHIDQEPDIIESSDFNTDNPLSAHLFPDLKELFDYEWKDESPKSNVFNSNNLDIHFVIPDYGIGGGGHMNIFRMLAFFEYYGHDITIWIFRPHHQTVEEAYDNLIKNYNLLRAKVCFIDESFSQAQGDAIFATSWNTVWPVGSASSFKRKFYFIQDYETTFYPASSRSILAESTYHKGLDSICASSWLGSLMEKKYGNWSCSFDLAADRNIFYPKLKEKNKIPRIIFYARIHTERRAVELGLIALELLAQDGVEFHVDCFGMDPKIENMSFSCNFYETRTPEELSEIYNQSDIGIVFSLTNYSLVPQEMMACGLPIIEFDCESTRAIYPENAVTFAGPTPDLIKDKIKFLLKSPEKRKKQSKAALDWVEQFSWEGAAKKVESGIITRLKELGYTDNPQISNKDAIKASIIVPTYNGGELFKTVLKHLLAQEAPWTYELIVLDSESSDGTAEYVKEFKNIRFYNIPKAEFNHGATRNKGAMLANGEFVAFITQDAIPATNKWLYNLVTILEHYPNAAGAFGRHIAHDDATFFTKQEIKSHFEGFRDFPSAVSLQTEVPHGLNENAWRGILRFYSDNNSCFRKSVWEKIPYRNVQYGEDQIWGDDVINAGYEKVYAYDAPVKHSHDYKPDDLFERSKIDGDYFKFFFNQDVVNKDEVDHIIATFNARDIQIGIDNNLPQEEIDYRISCNEAKFKGYLAGMKKELSMFSQDSDEKSKY
ncbi:rhamnosyltransferase WsaF family glycosyltransferase [Pseudoalteromonas distincta]|uniref:rhamnosyltransferase WsaF family glycosyltransferase n=1 Tax=Pseudoalteromonas distincta TaxID=77608 RepID=UPI0024313835|nr:glycosyltransferase [Pseudoalteromonas distincta]